MAETLENKSVEQNTRFSALFATLEQGINGQTARPNHEIRRKAIEILESKPFPTRRDEDWKYTSVAPVLAPAWAIPAATGTQNAKAPGEGIKLVFRNGIFDAVASDMSQHPEGLLICTVAEAFEMDSEQEKVKSLLESELDRASHAFVPLNGALATNGLYIRLQNGVRLSSDIHFIYSNEASDTPYLINPQSIIITGSNCELRFTETYKGFGGVYCSNILNRIEVGANSQVEHYKFQLESETAFQINNTRVFQERDSTYSNYNIDLGGSLVRNNVEAIMLGSNITSNLYGVFLGVNRQHMDTQSFVDHAHPHCQSNELYKGVLTDRAKGVFNGKVIVRQDAQKTNAYQQNSNLVLSPTAVMDTKPQLEIYADDVKCSHGATIGQLDESSVFYLRSRGIPDAEARRMLQRAFLQDVIENIEVEYLHDYASELLEEKFNQTIVVES